MPRDFRPIVMSDEEIDAAAEIDAMDVPNARAFWETHSPRGWEEILDAENTEEDAPD